MSHQVCILQHVFLVTQFSILMFVHILHEPYFLHIIADLFSVIHVLYTVHFRIVYTSCFKLIDFVVNLYNESPLWLVAMET